MKSFFFAVLCLLSLAAAPQTASAKSVRPLTRYLTATLHLRRREAKAVQTAVNQHPLHTRTPEEVVERLRTVLNADQLQTLTALTGSVDSYEILHQLASGH